MLVQSFMETLRPLVGTTSWDYIVLWKLSIDHRCIEWMDCCCAGTENIENGGEELNFRDSSSSFPCRDIMFPHPRIKTCELLDQLPTSILLDSGETGHTNNGVFLEGTTYESNLFNPTVDNGFPEMETSQMGNLSRVSRWVEPTGIIEDQMNDDSYVCENNRSDESDPNEDEDDAKYRRRTGKGPQSKNLMAERKRRKKLNDRLYSLRALVPKISKLDRASILGDAIDYVKELQKQVEDLQIELEEHSDDEDAQQTPRNETENSIPPSIIHRNGTKSGPKRQHGNFINGFHKGSSENNIINISKQNQELENTNEKVQQMEPQVEVFQLDGNEFFVKVFCEHKSGGFVRLMDALNSLGLEVTNVTATRHTCLVSSIFKVERKNDDTVQADHVKESLLELTRNPSRMWTNVAEESDNGNDIDHEYHMHHKNGDHSLLHSHQMNSYNLQHLNN
ncbi:hypothetical protein RD792_010770 [Penstemon davidsonii]|uniref:BHLH domain-containing protein n=1 Tax=Penstemon davidsonii TaxID=160366 RepID=A0ABR0D2R6_9LAMI|nr:hypothetical protein RD792_010770 [Penstemon davidsonii]